MGEHNRIQAEKEKNILEELVPKADTIQKEIQEKTGCTIYAKIEQAGEPMINITSPIKKVKFWQSQKKENAKQVEMMRGVLNSYYEKCKEIGLFPMAQITPRGAQVFYFLTKEKKEEISNLILPPNSNKSILVPQGVK